MKQAVSFVLGILFLILGIIGLALPVIPQVPFLLLAAWFFSISSSRFRRWVVSSELYHKYAREHVHKYTFLRRTFEQDLDPEEVRHMEEDAEEATDAEVNPAAEAADDIVPDSTK